MNTTQPASGQVNLVIADPNCASLLGHYFEHDAAVVRAAREAGQRAIVLAARCIDPVLAKEACALPTFRQDIWVGAGLGKPWAALRANMVFLMDLLRSIRRLDLAPDAVVFVPTFVKTQILALALLPVAFWFRPRVSFVYLIRYQPDFYRGPLCGFSFRLMERLARWRSVRLTTDSARLSRSIEDLTTLPVGVQAMPLAAPQLEQNAKAPDLRCHFVSLGNARDEKGIFEILAAIRLLEREGGADDIRFTLQCNDAQPDVAAAIHDFAQQDHPHCTLLFDKLSTETYYKILGDADVVLLPYWHSIYELRTSGVFSEALSAGKPVITTLDSWMADELSRHGAGSLCADRDPASLAASIRFAADNRDALARAAMAKRADWLAVNSASALLADLLTRGTPAVRSASKRALVIYPFADLTERCSGASRRCSLLLDYLAASGMEVEALQAGDRTQKVGDGCLVRGMGRASGWSRLLHLAVRAAMRVAPRTWRPHGWQIWEYLRLRLDQPMQRRIEQAMTRSDVVLLEYPFLAAAVVPIARRLGRKVVLTTHDVLSEQMTDTPLLHRIMWATEQRSLRLADDVVCVSAGDQAFLAKHGINALLSPNPTDARLFGSSALIAPREVVTRLYDIDLPGDDILLFVGSAHGPNMVAVDHLREIAASLEQQAGGRRIGVVVVGRCAGPERSSNFLALGVVDDGLLLALYGLAFAAVMPLSSGTGASLKTVEAMAAGVLVIGTPVALRGLDVENGQQCVIEPDINRYSDLIRELLQNPDKAKAIAAAGASFAQRYHYARCYSVYNRFLGLDASYTPSPAMGALDPILMHLAKLAQQRGLPGLGKELSDKITDQAAAQAAMSAQDEQLRHDAAIKLVKKDALWQWFYAGRYTDIVPVTEILLKRETTDAELHFLLAQSLHNSKGDLDRVWRHYVQAFCLGFDPYLVRAGLGRVEEERGRSWRASWHYLHAVAGQPLRTGSFMLAGSAARLVISGAISTVRLVYRRRSIP